MDRRSLLGLVVVSAAAAGFLSISGVLVALLGGWWGVAVGFVASFTVALVSGLLAWRGNGPLRRLVELIKPTDEGTVRVEDFEAGSTLRIPVGRPPWKR